MEWPDGKVRCSWANPKNERYIRYHDEVWGVPVHDDQKLFEMLILECFQAGLSWECVLNKQEAFQRAFDGFDLEQVCAYGEEKLEEIRQDPGIIRNRLKIRAAVANAKVFRAILPLELDGWTSGSCGWGKLLPAVRRHLPGPETPGYEICGHHHCLRLSTGGRRGLFPRGRLLSGRYRGRPSFRLKPALLFP